MSVEISNENSSKLGYSQAHFTYSQQNSNDLKTTKFFVLSAFKNILFYMTSIKNYIHYDLFSCFTNNTFFVSLNK